MTTDDLAALAAQLVEGAVLVARDSGQVEASALAAHVQAVQEHRRAIVLQVGATGNRIAVSAWTIPADSRDGVSGTFPLLTLERRCGR